MNTQTLNVRLRSIPGKDVKQKKRTQARMSIVVGSNEENNVYPVVAFGKSQFSVRGPGIEAVKTPLRRSLQITEDQFKAIITNKGVPSRAALKWEGMITTSNICMLQGREGEYPYISFDVVDHPRQKLKLIPVPSDVAIKLFPKILESARAEPAKFGLKLDDPDEATRTRHRARLAIFEWTPQKCSRTDGDGNQKPCVISPPLNGWVQVPTAQQIPNLGKEIVALELPGGAATKKSAKRKGGAGAGAGGRVAFDGMEVSTDTLPSTVDKIVSFDTKGQNYKIIEVDGVVMLTIFKKPKLVSGDEGGGEYGGVDGGADGGEDEYEDDGDEDE